MKNIFPVVVILLFISSCKLINSQYPISCSEFYVRNDLASGVKLNSYKFIDSGFYFTLDSFIIAPGETKMINDDCRYVDSIQPYPQGAYTKFIFSNNKTKLDTFSGNGVVYLHDSINIYNKANWTITGDNKLRKATYIINAKDSLEGR